MKLYLSLCLLFLSSMVQAQQPDTLLLKQLLNTHPELFGRVLAHPQQNEVQILYTQINRDKRNYPSFQSYSYRLNTNRYFYPASTVKLPTLIFALEKLNRLKGRGINMNTTMLTDSAFARQTKVTADTSAKNGKPSIEQYIKKILLVSDNDAYNRLYEFTGRWEINSKLKKYGLNHTRIIGRLAVGDGGEAAKHTNPIDFYDRSGKLIYHQPEQYDVDEYPMLLDYLKQGKGYLNGKDSLIMQPYDFSDKNVFPLADQQQVLKRLFFPEAFVPEQRFDLTEDQYQFIYRYMSMYPTESRKPTYTVPKWHATSEKFLFYGADTAAVPDPDIRIFNKIGDSYGYMIDNAYIADFKNNVEFMLTVVIQSNDDGIYNDNKYEYATVCLPFLKGLGQLIYDYELQRQKAHLPNLKKLKFNYQIK
jgi:hypothetical protein